MTLDDLEFPVTNAASTPTTNRARTGVQRDAHANWRAGGRARSEGASSPWSMAFERAAWSCVVGLCACTATTASPGDPFVASVGDSSDGGSEEHDDGGDDVLLDLGDDGGDPGSGPMGCNGIDFLFVIDDSKSMAMQQERLVASFPGFISAIQASLVDVTSYHVGVVTSDAYAYNQVGCKGLGDLVTVTGGMDSSAQNCGPFVQGNRYATEADDLVNTFPCMAKVGSGGENSEFPISAAVASLEPDKLAPGACNDGFVRDDSILVIVVVTDDPPSELDHDDSHPMTDTSGWHDAVVAAKYGNEAAAVVVGFVPWNDLSCLPYAKDSPNVIDFVQSFEHNAIASVCMSDYSATFASTIAAIQTSCEEFTPVG